MVGPARKREAVKHVMDRLKTSERRACVGLGQPRSTQRYEAIRPRSDAALIDAMHRVARAEPRAGYRGVARYLWSAGWEANIKRIHRLWKQEGLRVHTKTHKRRRLGSPENGRQRLKAEHINHVWSYDFVWDETEDGRRLKWLPALDEYTRECLILEVDYSITAQTVIEVLDRLVQERGAPQFIRSDNGPEFIAKAVKAWLAQSGIKTLYIEPGSPWENAYIESFNSRLRDEFLNLEIFANRMEAKVLGQEYREKYNHRRPHSSLGNLPPAEFAARCLAPLQPFDFVEAACAPQDSVINPKHQPNLS